MYKSFDRADSIVAPYATPLPMQVRLSQPQLEGSEETRVNGRGWGGDRRRRRCRAEQAGLTDGEVK